MFNMKLDNDTLKELIQLARSERVNKRQSLGAIYDAFIESSAKLLIECERLDTIAENAPRKVMTLPPINENTIVVDKPKGLLEIFKGIFNANR